MVFIIGVHIDDLLRVKVVVILNQTAIQLRVMHLLDVFKGHSVQLRVKDHGRFSSHVFLGHEFALFLLPNGLNALVEHFLSQLGVLLLELLVQLELSF